MRFSFNLVVGPKCSYLLGLPQTEGVRDKGLNENISKYDRVNDMRLKKNA